jgi:hypothetical protein
VIITPEDDKALAQGLNTVHQQKKIPLASEGQDKVAESAALESHADKQSEELKESTFLQFFVEEEDVLVGNGPGRTDAAKRCRCSRSKCIKQYCVCFQSDQLCTSGCICMDCMNDGKSEDIRKAAVKYVKRNENACSAISSSVKSCRCKLSRCKKKVNPSILCLDRISLMYIALPLG